MFDRTGVVEPLGGLDIDRIERRAAFNVGQPQGTPMASGIQTERETDLLAHPGRHVVEGDFTALYEQGLVAAFTHHDAAAARLIPVSNLTLVPHKNLLRSDRWAGPHRQCRQVSEDWPGSEERTPPPTGEFVSDARRFPP